MLKLDEIQQAAVIGETGGVRTYKKLKKLVGEEVAKTIIIMRLRHGYGSMEGKRSSKLDAKVINTMANVGITD